MKVDAKWSFLGLTVLCLSLVAGCSKEESPLGAASFSEKSPGGIPSDFKADLGRNSADARYARFITVAYASDDPLNVPQAPFPVLYLLHDYLGGAGYFEGYSLQSLMDEMYESREIKRMLVVTVDASNYFGGSYYRNSATTGNYEEMISSTITVIENNFRTHVLAGDSARAIGGHGMGGYGAVRYALDHPDMFGSVSSLSGPLSFGDPSTATGFWSTNGGMIPTVLEKNGWTGPDDTALYTKLKAGAALDIETNMLFAMASAFSPRPLRVFDSIGTKLFPIFPFTGNYDTVDGYEFYSGRPAGANTVSFTSEVDTLGVGVDLPFDSVGAPTDSVWALWRDSADVKTVFLRKKQENSALWNDIKIYIDVGTEDELGYLEQNRDFHNALAGEDVVHAYEEFGPVGALAAGHSDQLFARLKRIIKFHSDNLKRPDGPSPQ